MTPRQPWTLLATIGSDSGVWCFGRDDRAARPAEAATPAAAR